MSIIGWIVLGLISGFIASKIVNKSGEGFILDVVLGIIGAIVGGWLFVQLGAVGVTGFNIYSMFVARSDLAAAAKVRRRLPAAPPISSGACCRAHSCARSRPRAADGVRAAPALRAS